MKNLYILTTLTLITLSAFSQNFYIFTAKNSGNWSDANNWQTVIRQDNKKINEFNISKSFTILLDMNANTTSLGDVEINIAGTLTLLSDKSLTLTKNSKISLTGGMIDIDATTKKAKKDKKNKINEQLIIGGVVKFDAALEDQVAGTLFASQMTGASPFGFSSNSVLPVKFVSFNASKINDDVISVNWSTADELNNSHFEIQRSFDGINWLSIVTVFPSEDPANIHMYKYKDKLSAKSSIYYRIRQIDIDGKESFSPVKIIGSKKLQMDALIYVSGKNTVIVELKSSPNNNVTVRLINMNGLIVNHKANNESGKRISLVAYNAAPGAYVVQVTDANGMFSTKKILL